ncbi:MAG: ABC transporter substrate-binding protein [Chthoniobacterales bacterium]
MRIRTHSILRFVALLISLLMASYASGAEPVIRVGLFPNVTHAQALVAKNMSREGKGWFETRLGVKIDWYIFNAGPSAMESIFAKSLDVTYVGPSPAINAYARSNGMEVRVLAGSMRGGAALVVGEEVTDIAGLKGKILATPQLGNTQDVECRSWLMGQKFNVTLTGGDVRIIPTQNPDILTLFQQKNIAGAWTVEPWVTRLLETKGAKILHQDNETVTTILVARAAYLAENPELVKKFTAAHCELTEWIKANPEEAQRRVRDELSAIMRREMPAELIKQSWARLIPDASISLAPFEKFQERARQTGLLRIQANLSNLLAP